MKPTNIYHITVAKTASRWFVSLFNRIRKFTEMNVYDYEMENTFWDARPFTERHVGFQLPLNRICSPLYMGFNNYHDIPKPANYRSFCLWRDPRDVVVSFYFSCRYSHAQIGKHPMWRAQLEKMDNLEQELIWTINLLSRHLKIFDALKSYEDCESRDPNCKFLKYQDFFAPENHFSQVNSLLRWLELDVPHKDLKEFVEDLSFRSSTGRKQGQEDITSHLRKGIAGDHVNYFTPAIEERFWQEYGKNQSL